MATSGTKTFSLSIADAIEEAYELAGLEVKTGYDLKTAKRSLNLMTQKLREDLSTLCLLIGQTEV